VRASFWGAIATALAIACHPGEEEVASGDTGGVGEVVAEHALGGEGPGFATTRNDPLSTFPLDGSQPYGGPLPDDGGAHRFTVQTWLTEVSPDHYRLDVGLRAGAQSAKARDVGVRLALNPQAVRKFRLRDAKGSGRGTEVERVPLMAPGTAAGATYDLVTRPSHPLGTGVPQRTNFFGTVTVSWTEAGAEEQRILILERP